MASGAVKVKAVTAKERKSSIGRRLLEAMVVLMPFAATCQLSAPVLVQGFPTQTARIIVPYAPGATVDASARVIANKRSAQWGTPVVVDNRPGGSGTIGAKVVEQSTPDGHTMLFTISDTFAVVPRLASYKKTFQPEKDLVPVSIVATLVNAIVANPSVSFDSLPGIIEFARANPGALRYGSPGAGSNGHLAMEVLKSEAKLDIQHVPYRGIGPATAAAVSGEVHMTFAGYSARGLIEAGRLKPIVIAGPNRFLAFPNVPTTAEGGYPKVDSSTWLTPAPANGPNQPLNLALGQTLAGSEVCIRLRG